MRTLSKIGVITKRRTPSGNLLMFLSSDKGEEPIGNFEPDDLIAFSKNAVPFLPIYAWECQGNKKCHLQPNVCTGKCPEE